MSAFEDAVVEELLREEDPNARYLKFNPNCQLSFYGAIVCVGGLVVTVFPAWAESLAVCAGKTLFNDVSTDPVIDVGPTVYQTYDTTAMGVNSLDAVDVTETSSQTEFTEVDGYKFIRADVNKSHSFHNQPSKLNLPESLFNWNVERYPAAQFDPALSGMSPLDLESSAISQVAQPTSKLAQLVKNPAFCAGLSIALACGVVGVFYFGRHIEPAKVQAMITKLWPRIW